MMEYKQQKTYELSYGQKAFWFHHQLNTNSPSYNTNWMWKDLTNVDLPAFQQSILSLTEQHPCLRTTYEDHPGYTVQKVHRNLPTLFKVIDINNWSDEQLNQYIENEIQTPFRLHCDSPWRWQYLKRHKQPNLILLTWHHISGDLWSKMRIINEIKRIYPILKAGAPVTFPQQPQTFEKFVKWQQNFIHSKRGEKQWNYWKEQLGKQLSPLQLPLELPRPSQLTHQCDTHQFSISSQLLKQATQIASKKKVTLFTFLLTIFLLWLYRITGQEDLCIGVPTAGRDGGEFANTIGYFVNPIVLRAHFSSNDSFQDLLTQVNHQLFAALRRKNYPFPLIVEKLQPQRNLNQSPLFQTVFSWEEPNSFENKKKPLITLQQNGRELWDMGDFALELVHKKQIHEFDLSFRIRSFDEGLIGFFDFNPHLFREATIVHYANSYQALLTAICLDPSQQLSAYPLIDKKTKTQLILQWNPPARTSPQKDCIHHIFTAQAAQTPDKIALNTDTNKNITYGELDLVSNQIAHYLRKQGMQQGEKIGICLERSPEVIYSMLAIAKIGACFVPLDPQSPKERFDFMIADTEIKTILTQKSLQPKIQDCAVKLLYLDQLWAKITQYPTEPLQAIGCPQDLFYVMYTSGSTGNPKGVCITHQNVARLVINSNYAKLNSSETFLSFAPISFDASTFEIWGSLLNGAKLVLFPPILPSLEELGEYIQQRQVSTLWLTAGLFHKMADGPLHYLQQVRQLLIGGDILSVPHVRKAQASLPNTQLINGYGPTENTTFTCCYPINIITDSQKSIPIGKPISNTQVYILDPNLQPVPVGVPGELYTGGAGVSRGYLNQPKLTKQSFIPNPFSSTSKDCLYRTGDLAKWQPDGNIEFLGRIDNQIKIRGFRIELGEIETCLHQHPSIRETCVLAQDTSQGEKKLTAYYIPKLRQQLTVKILRKFLRTKLPDYMIPSAFVELDSFPLTSNGKLDRKALPEFQERSIDLGTDFLAAKNTWEKLLEKLWCDALDLPQVGTQDNFFDLGGGSFQLIQVFSHLPQEVKNQVKIIDLFQYPTICSLARLLEEKQGSAASKQSSQVQPTRKVTNNESIAIIGLAGRFPGADSVDEFWQNLKSGKESIRFFDPEELLAAGIDATLLEDPNYVLAKGSLKNIDRFDADFFKFSPREAEITDPQQRIFLECAWSSLENAGYSPDKFAGKIGVFAGSGNNTYYASQILPQDELRKMVGDYHLMIANNNDFLCTKVAYKLNLNGPAVTVQSACSTSLLAIHMGCQSLKQGESDMVLAGGVSIFGQEKEGYLYHPGGILSPDGHCRAFDHQAAGTVPGQGVGLVVLKRLSDAQQAGDSIYAIIKGSAINNDGALKVGYLAPGIEGQTKVIQQALALANVLPESVSYIEAHGTGTAIGDPIETHALTKAYAPLNLGNFACGIGSVKTNLGHLDAASGVTSLIKLVLSLKKKQIPPTLHFEQLNPNIDFKNSPFTVNSQLKDWKTEQLPRRGGVSAFGIGGTNVHMILEEYEAQLSNKEQQAYYLLPVSAKSKAALTKSVSNLANFIERQPSISLKDMAFTLQAGRSEFAYRSFVVTDQFADVTLPMQEMDRSIVFQSHCTVEEPENIFMFPGQGSQYCDMAKGLYQWHPFFREQLDLCFSLFEEISGKNLGAILFPVDLSHEKANQKLEETCIAQPAIFAIEYSLAKLWISWGITPHSMIGHSLGEYTAACLAGVFTLKEAFKIITARGELIQQLPAGKMLSVRLSESELQEFLGDDLSLAAINTPNRCVVSGPSQALLQFEKQMARQEVDTQRLHTSHAFHSQMMEPILEEFREVLESIELKAPHIPFISCLSGQWITETEVKDPNYWKKHLRQTTRFSDGIDCLLQEGKKIFLEVGPGHVLSTSTAQHSPKRKTHWILNSIRQYDNQQSDVSFLLTTLGRVWLAGGKIDWQVFNSIEKTQRIALPTYPFQRKRYWVETISKRITELNYKEDLTDWLYTPDWHISKHLRTLVQDHSLTQEENWLIFRDQQGLADSIIQTLRNQKQEVTVIDIGAAFQELREGHYILTPGKQEDFQLFMHLYFSKGKTPHRVLHFWNLDLEAEASSQELFQKQQQKGFFSLLYFIQSFQDLFSNHNLDIKVINSNLFQIHGQESLQVENSPLISLTQGISIEYPNVDCLLVDLDLTESKGQLLPLWVQRLTQKISLPTGAPILSYRKGFEWKMNFKRLPHLPTREKTPQLRQQGVYCITGGLGKVSLILAEYLARQVQAKLILLSRSGFIPRKDWNQRLDQYGLEDSISQTILQLQKLEALGAEILITKADVSHPAQMKQAFIEGEKAFGKLQGVIHAAGNIGGNTLKKIKDLNQELVEQQFIPKVYGLYILEKLLRDKPLDFVILLSSLSTIVGGADYTAYAAANQFMDSFAQKQNQHSTSRWITLDWDGWQTKTGPDPGFLIPPQEGREVFHNILEQKEIRHFVISTLNLQQRLLKVEDTRFKSKARILHLSKEPALQDDREERTFPRNNTEQTLAEIWGQFLGLAEIDVYDDFFELGGDSLMALRLISSINEAFSLKLSETSIQEYPKIAEMAEVILLEATSPESLEEVIGNYRSLVKIKKGRSGQPPLFLVHTGGGLVFYYQDFAKFLSPEQALYAFRYPTEELPGSIEAMADFYLQEMLQAQPKGPYFLGGASFGGLVAYEMACQLTEQGEKVALLSLIDSPCPPHFLPHSTDRDAEILVMLFQDSLEITVEELSYDSTEPMIAHLLSKAQKRGQGQELTADWIQSRLQIAKITKQAMEVYIPRAYSGKTFFFKPEEQLAEYPPNSELGWLEHVQQKLEVKQVGGNHYTMNMDPHVSKITIEITKEITKEKEKSRF